MYTTEQDLAHLHLFAQRIYTGIAGFYLFESSTKILLRLFSMSTKKLFLRKKNSSKDTPHNFLVVISLDITIMFSSSVSHVFHIGCLAYGISK